MRTLSMGLFVLIWFVGISSVQAKLSREGGVTVIGQASDDSNVKSELSLSFDYTLSWKAKQGVWVVYVEGSTTTKTNRVASLVSEANGDAGSALNSDGTGRLQISEIKYTHNFRSGGALTVGLVDPTAYLDGGLIMNDETTNFVAGPFVNNSSIEFPDYTLGVVYQYKPWQQGPTFVIVWTGSHGLADNSNASYNQLLDLNADGKGSFVAFESIWESDKRRFSLGTWYHSGDHAALAGSGTDLANFGLYSVYSIKRGAHTYEARAGFARAKVSQTQSFFALGYQYETKPWTLGAAWALSGLSDKGASANQDDSVAFEVYAKRTISKSLAMTAALVHIENSQFDASPSGQDASQSIVSLRLQYAF